MSFEPHAYGRFDFEIEPDPNGTGSWQHDKTIFIGFGNWNPPMEGRFGIYPTVLFYLLNAIPLGLNLLFEPKIRLPEPLG